MGVYHSSPLFLYVQVQVIAITMRRVVIRGHRATRAISSFIILLCSLYLINLDYIIYELWLHFTFYFFWCFLTLFINCNDSLLPLNNLNKVVLYIFLLSFMNFIKWYVSMVNLVTLSFRRQYFWRGVLQNQWVAFEKWGVKVGKNR